MKLGRIHPQIEVKVLCDTCFCHISHFSKLQNFARKIRIKKKLNLKFLEHFHMQLNFV